MKDVRVVLAGLTTRGRSLLSAGAALVLCALALGQRDLLRAGVFLVALPLAAGVVVVRTRYRLSCARQLDPPRVELGRPTQVRLRLSNVSRLPSGTLRLEDEVAYVLGTRPRFTLDRVEPRGVREVSYELSSPVRGVHRVGPLAVRLADPFGLCEVARSFASTEDLVVHPVVVPLPPRGLGGDWAAGGESGGRSAAASGTDDVSTREYRHGDDLRKVHWKSTARVGELMVRREEQPTQSRATLLLDTRARAHRGDGPDASFEWAASAVASIGVSLLRAGYVVQLLTDDDRQLVPPGLALTEPLLLDVLAGIDLSRGRTLSPALTRLRRGVDGALVAVLGTTASAELGELARLRTGSAAGTVLLLEASTWGGSAPSTDADASVGMVAGGWSVARVRAGDAVGAVWSQVSGRSGTPSRPPTHVEVRA